MKDNDYYAIVFMTVLLTASALFENIIQNNSKETKGSWAIQTDGTVTLSELVLFLQKSTL